MSQWIRFYNLDMVCPLCQHDDACSLSADGKTICCCRVKSNKLIGKPFAGGYLHPADKKYNPAKLKINYGKKKLLKNWHIIQKYYKKNLHVNKLNYLAKLWKVQASILEQYGLGWDGEAYTIPTYNTFFNILGIQRRFLDNSKKWVTGSEQGLFLIENMIMKYITKPLLICEGFSDTVIGAQLGYTTIGRTSCGTGIDLIVDLLTDLQTEEVVIIGDNDEAGKWGAELTQSELEKGNKNSKIIYPPKEFKDLREWFLNGLSKTEFDKIIKGD